MNTTRLDRIVNAVLYEGYILYPYRPSSKKNCRGRFTFGRVYPRAYSDAQLGAEPCAIQTECLLRSHTDSPTIDVVVRFLQPMWRLVGEFATPLVQWPDEAEPHFKLVPGLSLNGKLYQPWQEAVERTVSVPPLWLQHSQGRSVSHPFCFPATRALEPIRDEQGGVAAVLVRRQDALGGQVEIEAAPWDAGGFKVTVRIVNETVIPRPSLEDQDAVLMRTFASTHTILQVQGGEFISLTEPPPEYQPAAAACRNLGTWPVLVGDEAAGQRDTLLSSPIILPDYPQIAPESRGDFFDGTEIDEMLTLRVLTLTDDEKREMRSADECARRILERTEALPPDHLYQMHGTMRDGRAAEDFFNARRPTECISMDGVPIKAGDRVRIRPKGRADAMDLLLAGKIAIVEAVEQDAESQFHLAVVMEDDPGKDLGLLRQPGHRFFYGVDEVEPLTEAVS
jgi:hypothetical protein